METAVAEKPAVRDIPLTGVESSQIKAIGHDAESNTLAIQFHSGGLYHYDGVTAADYEKFLAAKSSGKHLGAHIKDVFPYRKIS